MKNNRYKMIEVKCAVCDREFMARETRVRDGLGKYCSKECSYVGRNEIERKKWGRKDLARKYKVGGRLCARWYDENGKTCSTSYQRWWWEMNVGEIPDGMVVILKDNDPLNIDPSNLILGTKKDATDKGRETLKKDRIKWVSAITKRGNAVSEKWRLGSYENVKGENHWAWKGGNKEEYPKEFRLVKDFVKSRDNYQCQICSKDLTPRRSGVVHHRDGIKKNSGAENLILLCVLCHRKVHSRSRQSPPIMALREELL